MRRSWLVWSLPVLLFAGVSLGLVLDRSESDGAPSGPSRQTVTESKSSSPRPQFDCDEQAELAYTLSPESRERHVQWLTDTLELSEDQVRSMRTVFADASFRAEEFWREARDRYCTLRDEFYGDIRGVLEPSQEAELDRTIRERKEQRERMSKLDAAADRQEVAPSKRP